MKMKLQRQLKKEYKHTCSCMGKGKYELLDELPKSVDCQDAKFYEKDKKGQWIDVTKQVKIIKY